MEIKGIDVSRWQGEIDWEKVGKSGVRFAMIKALHGKKPDPRFEANIRGAAESGISAGAYVFSLAKSSGEAEEEAEAAVSLLRGRPVRWPVAMDFESPHFEEMTESERKKVIRAFCGRIKSAGFTPMLYSSRDWLTRVIPASVRGEYPIWLAQWRAEKPEADFDFAMWQSGTGRIPGIDGEVDLDVSYVDFASVSPKPLLFRITRPRSRGEAYLLMQRALNAAGYCDAAGKPLKEDGVWGARSMEAFSAMLGLNGGK